MPKIYNIFCPAGTTRQVQNLNIDDSTADCYDSSGNLTQINLLPEMNTGLCKLSNGSLLSGTTQLNIDIDVNKNMEYNSAYTCSGQSYNQIRTGDISTIFATNENCPSDYTIESTTDDTITCTKPDVVNETCEPGFTLTSVSEEGVGTCTPNESFTSHIYKSKSRKERKVENFSQKINNGNCKARY